MGFISFAGRVLFASVFLLSAYQEFVGICLRSLDFLADLDSSTFPGIDIWFNEYGIDGGPAAKALKPKYTSLISRVTSNLGVEVPNVEVKHLVAANIALKGIGGLLFILSSSFGASLLLLHLVLSTPIIYDFNNYGMEKSKFTVLFVKFSQNLALFGALLFYLGMKNSVLKRHPKKKTTKPKTH